MLSRDCAGGSGGRSEANRVHIALFVFGPAGNFLTHPRRQWNFIIISDQFDLVDLLANRNGPLPNDRPHNVKLLGTYQQPIKNGVLTLGLTFSAYSGRPINCLLYTSPSPRDS